MIDKSLDTLSGAKKVAALLILLGPDVSSEVLKRFAQSDVERISGEIVRLGSVTADQRDQIIKEFELSMTAASNIAYGGVDFARDLLEKSLGAKQAEALIERFSRSGGKAPF